LYDSISAWRKDIQEFGTSLGHAPDPVGDGGGSRRTPSVFAPPSAGKADRP
jgi:hypothetical protein